MEQKNLDDSTSVYNMVYWDLLLEKKKIPLKNYCSLTMNLVPNSSEDVQQD